MSSTKKFIFKNTFKLSLQCLFNVFILFNIVLNLKLNSKQKIDPKMRKFKNLEKIWIILKKFRKKGVANLHLAHDYGHLNEILSELA